MEKKIDKLQDHFVVCGAGLTTRHIISELITVKQDFVLVSNNDEQLKSIKEDFKDIFFIQGDPTYNQTLEAAGVGEAKGLITALNDDRDNILVVITAKSLNPNIRIIARATHTESIPKLKSVGAEAIISPTLIGGLRMVSEAIRPSVVSFLDTMLRDKTQTMRVEEFTVEANSSLINKKLAESKIREKTSLLVVALKHPGTEHFIYNPSASEVIQSGTIIILIGNVDNLLKLKEFV